MSKKIPTYCQTCYVGPDPIKVVVEKGKAVSIEPNPDAAPVSPSKGRPCVKAYSLIDKLYNPNRVRAPLLRQNPRKGRDEDPEWEEISWDEALDILSEKLRKIKEERGITDENGYPNLALTLGMAGAPEGHFGTLPAFLSSWGGPVDLTIGTGQGIKCYHSEHIYHEFWHRGFEVVSDLPRTKYILSFGHSSNASDGVGVWRTADAREKELRFIQVEPHLSVTGATADKWIPIKPKTDATFLCSMINTILYEMDWEGLCDLEFIKGMTNGPYLIGPNGYYIRDEETEKPLIWDSKEKRPKTFDDPTIGDAALTGEYQVNGNELGPDDKRWKHHEIRCKPSFQLLIEAVKEYTPEYAEEICGIPGGTIREITEEFVENAMVGTTIEIEGERLPYRPVSIILGKTVNNAPGGFEACWGRIVLLMLVGALEVPGGTIGADTKLYPPYHERWSSVRPGKDGFMDQDLNPTDKESWPPSVMFRGPYTALSPFNCSKGWAGGIAPYTLAWLFMDEPPENWPKPSLPDVWMIYRANPAKSQFDPELVENQMKEFPFIVHFNCTVDETSWYADLILPDHTDLEGTQLKLTMNRHFQHVLDVHGFILKQPVVEPLHDTKEMTDILTEIADRVGILEKYNDAINRGVGTGTRFPLSGEDYDYSLELDKKYQSDEIWDRVCRACTMGLSNGEEEHGLNWFKENSYYAKDMSLLERYLHPKMKDEKLRYEIPYQETIRKVGKQLGKRLHEKNIHWWDGKLDEYRSIPKTENFLKVWKRFYEKLGEDPENYDAWLLSTRSMQYSWTSNVSSPSMKDAADSVSDFGGVVINSSLAEKKGIENGDKIVIESPFRSEESIAIVREGIRPDVALIAGQFGQWKRSFARDFKIPNLTDHTKLDIDVLDAGGSGADIALVRIYKVEG